MEGNRRRIRRTVTTTAPVAMQENELIKKKRRKIEVGVKFYERWERVGTVEGLRTDTQIMRFLIQSYENLRESTACCVRCQTPLTLYCSKCQLPAHQTAEMQKAAVAARKRLADNRDSNSFSSDVKAEPEDSSQNKSQNESVNTGNAAGDDSSQADIFRLDDPIDNSDDEEQTAVTSKPSFEATADSSPSKLNVSAEENGVGISESLKAEDALFNQSDLLSGTSFTAVGDVDVPDATTTNTNSQSEDEETVKKVLAEFTSVVSLKRDQPLGLPKKRYDRRGDKPSVCSICEKVFPNRPAMKAHRVAEHSVERPYQCTLCSASFKVKKHRKDHMLSHTGEKPFLCTVCGQGFSFHCGLKTHMRTHTKERPFVCKDCGAAFMQSCNLKVHLRTHTGERPFVCTVCGFAFTTSSHLIRHMATHGDERKFACQECGRAFKTQACMKAHERTHKGEKPAQCPVCGARFANMAYIKVHMRSHTGERPYVCDICSASFKESGKLTKHKRQNHNTK